MHTRTNPNELIKKKKKNFFGDCKRNQPCYTKTENQVQVKWQVNIQLQQNSELYMKGTERGLEVCFLAMVPLMTE